MLDKMKIKNVKNVTFFWTNCVFLCYRLSTSYKNKSNHNPTSITPYSFSPASLYHRRYTVSIASLIVMLLCDGTH